MYIGSALVSTSHLRAIINRIYDDVESEEREKEEVFTIGIGRNNMEVKQRKKERKKE